MADNTVINPGSGGDTISTDDVTTMNGAGSSGVKVARSKATWGPDGTSSDVAFGTGLPVQGDYLEVTGSVTSATSLIAQTDCRSFGWISLQITAVGSGTVTFQASNDGTTWKSVLLIDVGASVSTTPVATATAVGQFHGPVRSKYFRAYMTSYSSGTFTATAEFMSSPQQWGVAPVTVGNTVAVTNVAGSSIYSIGAYGGMTDHLSSSARTTSGNSTAIQAAYGGYRGLSYNVDVTAVSGSSPTLDVKLQGSFDNSTWFDTPSAAWSQISTTGTYDITLFPGIAAVANRRINDIASFYMRIAYTIGGSTPSFTFSTRYNKLS